MTIELTFQNVTWESPKGSVACDGHVALTISAGDPSCDNDKPGHCAAGFLCNKVAYDNQGTEFASSACGRTIAAGAELGTACKTAGGNHCVAHGSSDRARLLGGCGGAEEATPFGKKANAQSGYSCDTELSFG